MTVGATAGWMWTSRIIPLARTTSSSESMLAICTHTAGWRSISARHPPTPSWFCHTSVAIIATLRFSSKSSTTAAPCFGTPDSSRLRFPAAGYNRWGPSARCLCGSRSNYDRLYSLSTLGQSIRPSKCLGETPSTTNAKMMICSIREKQREKDELRSRSIRFSPRKQHRTIFPETGDGNSLVLVILQ